MKKQLIALAVAAAVITPMAAMAEATVYGRAHVSLDFDDDGVDSSTNISSNASRVGFKASMDLDNGMKAGAQMEGTVGVDAGGFNLNRNTFASLGGGFGEVRIGLHDTPFKDVRSKLDMFGDRVGDLRNFTRMGYISVNAAGDISLGNQWDERFKNALLYISPKLGGSWVLKGQYSTNQGGTTADGPNANEDAAYALSVNGMAGPIGLWLAYQNNDFADTSPGVERKSTNGYRVGASFKSGPFKVNAMYQSTSDGAVLDPAGDAVFYFDRDVWSLGGAFKMNKMTFKLQYAMADDLSCTNGVDCADTGATMYGLGVDYDLGQKSTVYIMYAATDNDPNGIPWTVTGGGGHGDNVGTAFNAQGEATDPSSVSIGYIVNF